MHILAVPASADQPTLLTSSETLAVLLGAVGSFTIASLGECQDTIFFVAGEGEGVLRYDLVDGLAAAAVVGLVAAGVAQAGLSRAI